MLCQSEESAGIDKAASRREESQHLPQHQKEASMGDLGVLEISFDVYLCVIFCFL